MPELPRPAPGGLCTCRAALFFDRRTRTLVCRRCRKSYRWLEQDQWDPYRKFSVAKSPDEAP